MIIGYIKNAKDKQDYQNQYNSIAKFAADNSFEVSCIYSDDSFENIKLIIPDKCTGIVINNISLIGTTLPDVRDNLYFLKKHNLSLYSVSDNYYFTKNNLTDEMLRGVDLAIDIRYKMVSVVTKKALAKKKETGFRLGRTSKNNKKQVLLDNENELFSLLDAGVSKVQIAKHFNISPVTIYNFLNHNEKYRNVYIKGAKND